MTVRGSTRGVERKVSIVDQDTEDLDAVSYTPTAPKWARRITRLLFRERACGAAGAG